MKAGKGPAVIASLRAIIVEERPRYLDSTTGRRTDTKRGVFVDVPAASAVVQVYDALSTLRLRRELLGLPVPLMVRLAREVLRLAREYQRNGEGEGSVSCAPT